MGPWIAPLAAIAMIGYVWVGPFTPAVVALFGAALTAWMLLAAPVVCGAAGRQGPCRNNATGLLRGCWIRQHKWQKTKAVLVRPTWQKVKQELWTGPKQMLATLATVLSILTGLQGLLGVLLN